MRTAARGLRTESGWEKWIRSSDEYVFYERGERKEESHYLYRSQTVFICQTLVHCKNREGLRMKVRFLVEDYLSLK